MRRIIPILLSCLSLTACTLASHYKPDASVTTPAVGHPPPPASAQAAMASQALTPYTNLASGSGLAPNESFDDLRKACMTNAGYSSSGAGPFGFAGVLSSLPWGPWGYLGGSAAATQQGFSFDLGVSNGLVKAGSAGERQSTAQTNAMIKCLTYTGKFDSTQYSGPLSLINTLNNDLSSDVQHDPAVRSATRAWSACMTQNGYHITDPGSAQFQAIQSAGGFKSAVAPAAAAAVAGGSGATVVYGAGTGQMSPSQRRAEIALAVTDADCTQSTDLAGIYFAVQTSYSQQLVNLNSQALSAAVVEYRTAYQKALAKLPR